MLRSGWRWILPVDMSGSVATCCEKLINEIVFFFLRLLIGEKMFLLILGFYLVIVLCIVDYINLLTDVFILM